MFRSVSGFLACSLMICLWILMTDGQYTIENSTPPVKNGNASMADSDWYACTRYDMGFMGLTECYPKASGRYKRNQQLLDSIRPNMAGTVYYWTYQHTRNFNCWCFQITMK
jgi:hypothetical protein